MYQSPYNPSYIIPDLLKYQCLDCEAEFILSEKFKEKKAHCPYCKSDNVEAFVAMVNPDRLEELGCMAISIKKINL